MLYKLLPFRCIPFHIRNKKQIFFDYPIRQLAKNKFGFLKLTPILRKTVLQEKQRVADDVIKLQKIRESTSSVRYSICRGKISFTCKVGDYVRIQEVLMEIEDDKSIITVPAQYNGIIEEIMVKNGAYIRTGQALFKLIKTEF